MIDLNVIWVVGCAGLVLMMQPGFMCLESGLTRSKNSINVATKNLADLGISICFFLGVWLCPDVWIVLVRVDWHGWLFPER